MPKSKPTNVSKLTKKYQATIPMVARQALDLIPGDNVLFEVKAGSVVLKKASSVDWDYLKAVSETLSEWESIADEEAYSDL